VEHFDAIVVGAGPAGSTTAYRLAQAGANVLLLDKGRFPRDKPCGGAISTRALNELPLDPKPVVEHIVDRMELSYRGGRPFVRGKHTPLAYMTQRRRLDHFLTEQAADAGANFRDNATATDISEHGARIDGKWTASEILIGADGANGPTTRSLDLADTRIYGVALEGNLPHSLTNPKRWQGKVVIELGTIPGGYCWIFPKGDHINIGVGGWENTGPKLRKHLQELQTTRIRPHQPPRPEGISTPGTPPQRRTRPRTSASDRRRSRARRSTMGRRAIRRLPQRQARIHGRAKAPRRPNQRPRRLRPFGCLAARTDDRVRMGRKSRTGPLPPTRSHRPDQPTRMAHGREHAPRQHPRARRGTRRYRIGCPEPQGARTTSKLARDGVPD
jgi:geranylgeranyl reductase family protein